MSVSKMQQNLVCRGCLSVEGKFAYLHEFTTAQAYENLIGIPLLPSDGFPQHLCLFCFETLHKFVQFKARCHKALELLHQAKVKGCAVTKEYFHSAISSCPELKPRFIRTKIIVLDISPSESESDNNLKEDDRGDILDYPEIPIMFEVGKEKHEPIEDITEQNYGDDVIDLEDKPCHVFVDNIDNVLNKNVKRKVIKDVPKRICTIVKAKDIVKKNVIKIMRKNTAGDDKQIAINYAKAYGFDVTFLSPAEQIQQIEDKKKEIVTDGNNCPKCGKHFRDLNALDRHEKNYHVPKPVTYVCSICTCVFERKGTLLRHKANHRWIFTCKFCGFKTNQKTILQRHQEFHEGRKRSCKHCDKEFSKETTYFSHMKAKHASFLSWCDLCGEFFISEKGVRNHKNLAHDISEEFPNDCSKCDKSFKNVAALERHTNVNGCDLPNCAQCGDSFHSEELLKYHLVQRHIDNADPMTFDCTNCPVRFHNAAALDRHHCGAAVVCTQCGDNFESPQLLTDHVIVKHHIFKCGECGKDYPTSAGFKRHYSVAHIGKHRRLRRLVTQYKDGEKQRGPRKKKYPEFNPTIRKWRVVGNTDLVMERLAADGGVVARDETNMTAMCEVCGKKFKSAVELNTHLIFHTEENHFTCEQCSKGFKTKGQLRLHERVHTGERPYQCPDCPKAFKTNQSFSRHYLIHSGLRRHMCQICEKTFQTSSSVKAHIKTVHMKIPMPPRIRNRRKHQ